MTRFWSSVFCGREELAREHTWDTEGKKKSEKALSVALKTLLHNYTLYRLEFNNPNHSLFEYIIPLWNKSWTFGDLKAMNSLSSSLSRQSHLSREETL